MVGENVIDFVDLPATGGAMDGGVAAAADASWLSVSPYNSLQNCFYILNLKVRGGFSKVGVWYMYTILNG